MLTLPGETQASRVALSLLQAVGQPQSVARSLREFEDVALALTGDGGAGAAAALASAKP